MSQEEHKPLLGPAPHNSSIQVEQDGHEPRPGVATHNREELIRRFINYLSLLISVMVFALVVCYPVALCLGSGISMTEVNKPLDQECVPTISESDKTRFLNYVEGNSKLLYVNFTVDLNQTCDDCSAFAPMSWVWVSTESSEVTTFLSWQEDYAIWSFGILDFYATRNIQMSLNFSSSCAEKFGEATNMKIIAETLNNMTETKLSHMKQDYNDSLWCFRVTTNKFTNSEKYFVRNFRYFVQDLGTVCYKLRNNDKKIYAPNRFWTNIPFCITFIALMFSPVLYVYFRHYLANKSPVPWLSWGGLPSDKVPENDKYIYQGFKSPVTLSSIVFEKVPATSWNSVILAALIKFLLLLFSPVVIYVKVLIYHFNRDLNFLLERQINNGIPIGFSSMLFTYEQKSRNFLTLTFGPCYLFLIYYILGTILIINHSLYLEIKLQDDDEGSKIPLSSLHLKTMDSMINETLKNKVLNVVAENTVNHSLSWNFLQNIWDKKRLWQIPCSVVFHQIPFLFINHLILKSNMMRIAERLENRDWKWTLLYCIVLGFVHFVFLFTLITIFFASFEFLALIVTFSYIGMVTYPTESAGYFLFAIAAAYYLCMCLRDIAQKYQHLLTLSVEASKELETDVLLKKYQNQQQNQREYVKRAHDSCGIRKRLFGNIVEKYEPKATTVKMTLVKIVFVACVLAWTLKLVFKLHESYDLDPLVHIFSAFLAVSLPNLIWLLLNDFSRETRDYICKVKIQNFIENFWNEEELNAPVSAVQNVDADGHNSSFPEMNA